MRIGLRKGIGRPRELLRQAAHLAEAAALVAGMTVFAILPVDWASRLGGFIGRTLGPHLGLSRQARANIDRAMPANDEAENRRILRGMWDNLGRAVAEYPHLDWICAAESGRVEIVNEGAVTELLTDGQPGIVFGGHFGNWEVGPSTIHRLMGASLVSVYRGANNPLVDRLLRHWQRSRRAVAKGAEGGRDLLRHLNHGGHVAMLVDQKLNDGIAVPFFGRDAMTAPAIARLGLRFGCPVVPIRTERLHDAHFRFTVLSRLEIADTGNATADVLTVMTRVNAMIESWIRARPEQWLWLHRRWAN
jgi:Kdo2-lipid IVA lauroyltransferase/acyltransferase